MSRHFCRCNERLDCPAAVQLDDRHLTCDGMIVNNPFAETLELTSILYTAKDIADRVRRLAWEIDTKYVATVAGSITSPGEEVVLLGALTGAFMFLADLSRAIRIPHRVEMVRASSYHGGTESSGSVKLGTDLSTLGLEGTHILIVEDILDTGLTYQALRRELLEHAGVRSVQFCALLSKPEKLVVDDLNIDYSLIGFQMRPPRFVVGYGLDYQGYFRQLPFVAEAKPI